MPDDKGRMFADEIADKLGIAASDWRARVSRGHAPKPSGHVVDNGRARSYWDSAAIEEYIATAPRRGPRRGVSRPQEPATVPWELLDREHGDHDEYVRTAGRCLDEGCPRHQATTDVDPRSPGGAS